MKVIFVLIKFGFFIDKFAIVFYSKARNINKYFGYRFSFRLSTLPEQDKLEIFIDQLPSAYVIGHKKDSCQDANNEQKIILLVCVGSKLSRYDLKLLKQYFMDV